MRINEVVEVISVKQDADLPYCLTLLVSSKAFTVEELAYLLMVSPKTLEEWMLGRHLPLPIAFKGMLNCIVEKLFEKIENAKETE